MSFQADVAETALRERGSLKWSAAPEGVLPAWVAEMDVEPCPAIVRAVQDAVAAGRLGYPPPDPATGLPDATAAFVGRRFGWQVDPDRVVLCGDVMSGVLLALTALCEPAPVVVPTPAYPPFLDVVPLSGRELVPVPCVVEGGRTSLDLQAVDAALAAGARTVLIANPHNPLGRAYRRSELEALRDVVLRHDARVVSDDIHAPLVLPGATHVPYASLPGTDPHATTVLAASKGWNVPALKCAQLVVGSTADVDRLRALPLVANHGLSLLGVAANVAAYTEGEAWLDALVQHLGDARELFAALVRTHLPRATMLPLEATYLAWLDLTAYGHDDPAAACRALAGVVVNDGRTFGPGGAGHVRVNLATSLARVEQLAVRLGSAL